MKGTGLTVFLMGAVVGSLLTRVYDKRTYERLSPQRFASKLALNDYDYLLDVRTPEEWNQGHHPKATLLPIGGFVTELPRQVPNRQARILLYCKKGIRAQAAAQIAHRLGYKNVRYLDGTYEDLKKI